MSATSTEEPPYHTSGLIRLTRSQLIGTLAGLLLSVLLASLDQTIVGTAEPRIIASLSGFDRYPWVSTAYLLTSTLAVPIFAKLSDIYGRKWFFLGGAAGFVLASALCGASGTIGFLPIDGMSQLIVFRALQGIAGGTMMGLAFTIIGDVFSPVERGKYQGMFAATYGMSSIFGPTLGGWLTDYVSWRATFACQPAGGRNRDLRHVSVLSVLAPGRREAPHRLGGSFLPHRLHRPAADGAHLGHRIWLEFRSCGIAACDGRGDARGVSLRRNQSRRAADSARALP